MPHKNFYKFKARDNYELGLLMGAQFKKETETALKIAKENLEDFKLKTSRANKFLEFNQRYFPEYIEELNGYAKGANVDFFDIFALSLEDEVDQDYPHSANKQTSEKCTTLITNNGKLFAHNEDWDKGSEEKISIVEKIVGNLSVFELFYTNTLGGNSVSINSNGFIIGINSMVSNDVVTGVSKNFIARWLSETKNPDSDILKLKSIPRAQGHNTNIIDKNGNMWNIEYTSHNIISSKPESPFCHSNHYLSDLKRFEANTNENGTFDRYHTAVTKIRPQMTTEEVMTLMNDNSYGEKKSIMNERTIAKIIVDVENKLAKIWLLREDELGFVDYDLSNYFS